jgi:hypothetical protein
MYNELLIVKALQYLYPEQRWQEYEIGHWKDIKNQRAFLDQLALKLSIQKPEEWLEVGCKAILKEGGYFINYYNSSLTNGNLLLFSNLHVQHYSQFILNITTFGYNTHIEMTLKIYQKLCKLKVQRQGTIITALQSIGNL